MSEVIISGLLALLGTVIGTFGGIIASAKLTAYRIEQLEKRVGEHNSFAQRMPVLEEKIDGLDRRLTVIERKDGVA